MPKHSGSLDLPQLVVSHDAVREEVESLVSEGETLPIISESLHVEKVVIDRGGYRLTKRVEAKDVMVDESLRQETVTIERRPLHLRLPTNELPEVRYEGATMIVPVVKEILVTERRLVLVEEICITRVAGTYRDPQSVTLREEHIDIEHLEPITVIRSS